MELLPTHFPYCLKLLEGGRYILLNRNYKPIGNQTMNRVNYHTDPSAIMMTITPGIAAQLSWDQSHNVERIYLYKDGCIPTGSEEHMAAYLKRLAVLAKIRVST